MGIFMDIFNMMDNYEDRKVGRFEDGDLIVSTASITDSLQPYETAVAHPLYNSGKMIIVELYDTLGEAKSGHQKWIETMTSEELPESLIDVSTAATAGLCDNLGGGWWSTERATVREGK